MSWESQMPVLFHNGSVESQVDRLLDDAIQAVSEWSESWEPTCNIFEDSDGFAVQMALPGIEPSQIDVQVEHNVLRVKGERKSEMSEQTKWYTRSIPEGVFSCSFKLPAYVDHEKSTASYSHGVLTIAFPKREEARPRRIMIECQ
ncbi:MAG TPA: Hsp20/alpha crystallin family protein [Nitrospira sp.]|nr:Hsp20/alpha crystallin family protein [Nitrospira sp.]